MLNTYKKKFTALVFILLLLIILIYFLSIKPTIDQKRIYSDLKNKIDSIDYAVNNGSLFQNRLKEISELIGVVSDTKKDLMPELLFMLDSLDVHESVRLEEIPQTARFLHNDIMVQTNAIVLSGTFKDILKLSNDLEISLKSQKLISMKYYSQNNYYYDEPVLFCKLYFQSYCKSDSSENLKK